MSLGRVLLFAGLLLALTGAVFLALERFGLRPGRMPGDLSWQGRNWSLSVPLGTSILLSLLLTLLLWVFDRLRG